MFGAISGAHYGLHPGMSAIDEHLEALMMPFEYDCVKSALDLGSGTSLQPEIGDVLMERIGVKMAKLACLGPFWVLILGLASGISGISGHLGALVMHLE